MKSTTYLRTILTLGLGATRILPTLAQDDLEDERSGLCGFTLQAGGADIYRTNDWKLSNSNDNGRLAPASFYITDANQGRMYGGGSGGERCGFDPYLTCSDDTNDDLDRQPFIILSNSSLTFSNLALFHLCNNTAFTSTDPDDDGNDRTNPDDLASYPYIYPPVGTTNNTPRNYENCTAVTLVASGCQEDLSGAFTVSASDALRAPQATGSGSGSATSAAGNTAATVTGAAERVVLDRTFVGVGVGIAAMGFAWL